MKHRTDLFGLAVIALAIVVSMTGCQNPADDGHSGNPATGDSDSDFIYTETNIITIIGYKGAGGNVTIPNSVTSIRERAFRLHQPYQRNVSRYDYFSEF